MDLLVFLAQRQGQVVAKDALLDGVWGTDALSESALTRSITELRQTLEDDAERPNLIETIPKRGYRAIAPVRPVTPQPEQQTADWWSRAVQRRRLLAWLAVTLVVAIAATAAPRILFGPGNSVGEPRVFRFLLSPPAGRTYAALPVDPYPAISPDGRQIAVVASTPEATREIWLHALDALAAQPLTGTEGGYLPLWSPDGRFLGFFAHGKLKKMRAPGGPLATLCDAAQGFGATWSTGDVVLFAPNRTGGLYSVPASGGEPVPVTTLDPSREETSHRYPQFLPDGRHYIYLARSRRREYQGIYVGSLGSTERKLLVTADANAAYVAPGYLLFVRDSALMAQRFDLRRLELTGGAAALAAGLVPAATLRFAPFSASGDVLTYRTGGMNKTRLVWFDRSGRRVDSVGDPGRYLSPALSPDGSRLAVDLLDIQREVVDTWIVDLARGISSRSTLASAIDGYPLWAPDGKRIAFASDRQGVWSLRERTLDEESSAGMPSDRVLIESPKSKHPQTWSADGRSLVYVEQSDTSGQDLWLLPVVGERKPISLLQTPFNEVQAQLSPNGRWLAYTSDESGRLEVYVRSFPSLTGKWRISADGGCQPRWRADSRELFYVNGRSLMAVSIAGQSLLQPATPMRLFETHVGRNSDVSWDYVVAADGQRFLVKDLVYEEDGSPMVVVLNWRRLLRQ